MTHFARMIMIEFRCTRRFPYKDAGRNSLRVSNRNGHYIKANNYVEALHYMAQEYPQDIANGYWFDVQYWDGSERHGAVVAQDGITEHCTDRVVAAH